MGYYAEVNAAREERGVAILSRYRRDWDRGEDWETVATDLLSDLFHAAKGRFNYEVAIDRARGHFFEELREAQSEADGPPLRGVSTHTDQYPGYHGD